MHVRETNMSEGGDDYSHLKMAFQSDLKISDGYLKKQSRHVDWMNLSMMHTV